VSVIASVRKAVALLRGLSNERPELGGTELSNLLGRNKTVSHKLLRTVAVEGLVVQDPVSRKYRLGPRIMEIAGAFLRTQRLTSEAASCLRAAKMTTGLGVLDGDTLLYLVTVEAQATVNARLVPGERCLLHASAMGKCVLAFLPREEQDALLARLELVRLTPRTITNRTVLRKQLDHILRVGYAINLGERDLAIDSVAAPVWDYRGYITAAIGMAIPRRAVTRIEFQRDTRLTVEAARVLTERIGGHRPVRVASGARRIS